MKRNDILEEAAKAVENLIPMGAFCWQGNIDEAKDFQAAAHRIRSLKDKE